MLWLAFALLLAVFAVFELTPLDLFIQDRLYDFAAQRWLVDSEDAGPRLAFYTGPKALIILGGIALIVVAAGPERWRQALHIPSPSRRNVAVAVLTLGSVPALVGQLKAATNVFCPSEIRRYSGDVCFVRVSERFPESDRPARRGRCFPAGHASGGFALIGLVGLARTRRQRALAVSVALGAGGAMGFYQMAKGAHYLSHTVITAIIAWIVFLLWRRVLRVEISPPPFSPGGGRATAITGRQTQGKRECSRRVHAYKR